MADLANWNGQGVLLHPNEAVSMNPSSNVDMVIACENVDSKNNAGQVFVSFGATGHLIIDVPALQNAPVVTIHNFDGQSFKATNISQQSDIRIAAYGSGIGPPPDPLPADGQFHHLAPFQARRADNLQGWQRIVPRSTDGYALLVLYIGTKVTTILLNAPDCGQPQQPDTVCTPDNSKPLTQLLQDETVLIVNLSPVSSEHTSVSLTSL